MRINNIGRFIRGFRKYAEIKADETKKANSKYYGINSIVMSLLAVGFVSLFFLIGSPDLTQNGLLAFFLLLLLIVSVYVGPLIFLVYALISMILQFTLNKKPITWISLALFIIALGVVGFIMISSISTFA